MSTVTQTVLEQPSSSTFIPLKSLNNEKTQPVRISNEQNHEVQADLEGIPPPPDTAVPTLQKWNQPRGNIARLAAAFYSMFVFGLNDAAYGALLPYVSCLKSIVALLSIDRPTARTIL